MLEELELITAQELAVKLKCSKTTISRKVKAGVFPAYRYGSMYRFNLEEILAIGKKNDKEYKQLPSVVANGGRIG